jgi:LCP family protein required for cell wall assembly
MSGGPQDSPDPLRRIPLDGHDSPAGQPAQPGPGRPGRSRRRKIIQWTSVGVACALVIGIVAGYLKYRAIWDSIHRVSVSGLGRRPPQYNNALNLLVFASGSTAGLSRAQQLYWHVGNDASDAVSETLMIVHISPGRHLVTVVNIPRDTVVPVYDCASGPGWQGQQASSGAVEQIGDTLSYGGPACLWKTVEQQTGIRIDHFLELGYSGLVNVVNDIGGINVCLPVGVDDAYSGLRLAPGEHHINGVTYLEFWRTREDTGNGSDLQRIQRDDYLLTQTLQQVRHVDLLGNPVRLLRVVSDTAGALTTDSGLSQSGLLQIAESLHSVPARDYQFIEASNVLYPPNPNWVEFEQPQAGQLFSAIAHDAVLPARSHPAAAPGHPSTPAAQASSPAPVSKPTQAPVRGLGQGYGGLSGNASCTSDSGAFAGPLSPG